MSASESIYNISEKSVCKNSQSYSHIYHESVITAHFVHTSDILVSCSLLNKPTERC